MKVKEVYDKLREIDDHIDEIGNLIIDARASDTEGVTVGSQFLYTIRVFLCEYKNILGCMDIKEKE